MSPLKQKFFAEMENKIIFTIMNHNHINYISNVFTENWGDMFSQESQDPHYADQLRAHMLHWMRNAAMKSLEFKTNEDVLQLSCTAQSNDGL